jgi:uncharacterized protein involved in exopolysaccharide biosynthesis
MVKPQSATLGLEPWAQANDVESASAAKAGEALSPRILRLLRSCWVRPRLFLGILATGILLSLLYALLLPNIYTSTTRLMPPDSSPLNSNPMSLFSPYGSAITASSGSAILAMRNPGAIFTGILESRTVQEGVVKQFDLVHHYDAQFLETACKRLAKDSDIQNDQKTGIVTISVKADSPVLASKIAQGYVAELDRVVANNSTSAARRERIFLEGRLKEIEKDLDDSAKDLSGFSAKNRTIDIPSQGRAMVDSGIKLEDQIIQARSQLAGLLQSYSEDNVRVRATRARIAELQRQIDKMMGSPEETRFDANDSAYPSVSELPALGLAFSDLERRVREEEILWDVLTRQYEAARVQEAKEIPTVRVLDVANIPERKSSPIRSRIVILGALLSLVLAFMAVRAISVWEELDAEDERKRVVREIIGATLNSHRWYWRLPGMRWVHTRLQGSKQCS